MNCPKCGSEIITVCDTRNVKGNRIRRRRNCERCKYRFTTVEQQIDPRLDEYEKPMSQLRKEIRMEIIETIMAKVMETCNEEMIKLEGNRYGQE